MFSGCTRKTQTTLLDKCRTPVTQFSRGYSRNQVCVYEFWYVLLFTLVVVRFLESHWFVWATQMSHLPMPIDYDTHDDWVTTQLRASRNVEHSLFNDWWSGHLNFQIEHQSVVQYYYYYSAFNVPCVSHKDDESQTQSQALQTSHVIFTLLLYWGVRFKCFF